MRGTNRGSWSERVGVSRFDSERMRGEKSLSRRELPLMGPSATRPAKPLFVGSIPTGASQQHNDLADGGAGCPRATRLPPILDLLREESVVRMCRRAER